MNSDFLFFFHFVLYWTCSIKRCAYLIAEKRLTIIQGSRNIHSRFQFQFHCSRITYLHISAEVCNQLNLSLCAKNGLVGATIDICSFIEMKIAIINIYTFVTLSICQCWFTNKHVPCCSCSCSCSSTGIKVCISTLCTHYKLKHLWQFSESSMEKNEIWIENNC